MQSFDRQKILIIDDSPEHVRIALDCLYDAYEVFFALNGPEALSIARYEQPDLILLDIYMEEMDGFDVCRQIKSIQNMADIPIIFITGSTDDADHINALKTGGVDFIEKPFNTAILKQRVKLHLKLKSTIESYKNEIKEKEQALEALNTSQKISKSKSEFLANISHEFRTPMNAILGFTALTLEDPELSDENRKHLGIANKSAQELLLLLEDILDFSNLETGKFKLDETSFDLEPLINEVIHFFSNKAQKKGLTLDLDIHPDVLGIYKGDKNRLRQILFNILGNAVKFTNKGGIKLSIAPESQPQTLLFSVSDTGIGIPPEKLEIIFHLFTQADASSSRRYGGTGLGTTISKHLVNLMGGKIWVISEENKGSIFNFTIKLEPGENISQC